MKNLVVHFIAILSFGFSAFGSFNSVHAAETNLLDSLLEDNGAETFLPPDAAFKLELKATDGNHLQAQFIVAPGHYLYRERIKFEAALPAKIEAATLPAGEMKDDPTFGKQEVYHHDTAATIKLTDIENNLVSINATYQGCSEKGLCYAPIKKTFALNMADTSSANINPVSIANPAVADDDSGTGLLKSGNLWLIIAGFFGAGLLLSLTPCVLPMIPILSSIIVGSQSPSAQTSKLHTFGLSVAYVLGMALSYTLAGIAAGLSGSLLSQSLQNPWVLGSSAVVFVLLALSMFGFYELKLPDFIEDKVLNASNKLKGGKFLGVFIMGILSALIVSPCVAAPLAGALLYISQSQDVVLGGAALFALSLGMGVPLLMLGASAGQLLPKVGSWMNTVRNFFGVVLLGMAIWLISPVIPVSVQLGLWAALLIITAVYLNALDPLPAHAHSTAKFGKGLAIIMLVFGVAVLVGALSGAKSVFQPLSAISAGSTKSIEPALNFSRVVSVADLEQKLANAKGKHVMLDFYADWCVACKEFETFTFSDKAVQEKLKNTVLLQADVTANSDDDKALLKRFDLFGPPGIIFFDTNGQEIAAAKTVGFQNAERFVVTLNKIPTL